MRNTELCSWGCVFHIIARQLLLICSNAEYQIPLVLDQNDHCWVLLLKMGFSFLLTLHLILVGGELGFKTMSEMASIYINQSMISVLRVNGHPLSSFKNKEPVSLA